jgi:hypothetical protein
VDISLPRRPHNICLSSTTIVSKASEHFFLRPPKDSARLSEKPNRDNASRHY